MENHNSLSQKKLENANKMGKDNAALSQTQHQGIKKPSPPLNEATFKYGFDLTNVYIPNWYNKPTEKAPVISLGGTPILTHQNLTAIIAHQGIGKTTICESILSSYLNPDCDSLGFEVDRTCKGVLLIDNERTDNDVSASFFRVCRRAQINNELQFDLIAGVRNVPRLEKRRTIIENLLAATNCSLLMLDGIADLVNNPNDLEEAIECRIWLRELTVKFGISIFGTLHPNPGSEKPRGHIGSEIIREAESVLLAKVFVNDVRIITTDFEHGKNRNNPKLTTAFRWSDDSRMFVSANIDCITDDIQAKKDFKRRTDADKLALKIIAPPLSLSYTEIINKIMQETNKEKSTAKRKLDDWLGWGIIKKHEDGYYRYTV